MIPLLVSKVNPFPLWLLRGCCWRKTAILRAILAAALALGHDAAVTVRVGSRLARNQDASLARFSATGGTTDSEYFLSREFSLHGGAIMPQTICTGLANFEQI